MNRNIKNIILIRKTKTGEFRILIQGKEHPSGFLSKSDCRMWVANMWENGLYVGLPLCEETAGHKIVPCTAKHRFDKIR